MASYKDLGFASYSSYLKSSTWKKTKQKFFQSKFVMRLEGYLVCSCCKSSTKLNVHHKTYERLGKEKLTDLVLLCEECHNKTHEIEKYARKRLGNAHKYIDIIFAKKELTGKQYAKQRKKFLLSKSLQDRSKKY